MENLLKILTLPSPPPPDLEAAKCMRPLSVWNSVKQEEETGPIYTDRKLVHVTNKSRLKVSVRDLLLDVPSELGGGRLAPSVGRATGSCWRWEPS